MRGPGYRHDLDVRRVWRCAKCGKQRRLAGDVTTVACACGQPMELVEERRHANYAPQPLASRELTVESFALTEEELNRPVAARPHPEPRDAVESRESGPPNAGGPPRPARRPRPDRTPAAPPAEAIADDSMAPTESAPVTDIPPGDDAFGAGLEDANPQV